MRRFCIVLALVTLAGCGPRKTKTSESAPLPIRFEDVTESVGIRFERENGAFGKFWFPETMGGGGAFIDFDNDGWQDILLVNGDWWPGHPKSGIRPTLALYRNDNGNRFRDVTAESGLKVSVQGMGAAVGDYDADGFDDVLITAVGGNRLFNNQGGKRFRDVTGVSGVAGTGWSTSAAWMDYDRDGDLDLFVAHYVKWSPETDVFCGTVEKTYCRPQVYDGESCRLYRNDGARFTDITKTARIDNENSKALGVCVIDPDSDGFPDIVVANDMVPNFLYRNLRNSTFEERGIESGIAVSAAGQARAGMGIDAADYRNEGFEGMAIGNFFAEGIAFYDVRDPPYSERSKEVGVYEPSFPWTTFGLLFADFDRDGFRDLFFTNGYLGDVSTTNPGQQYRQPSVILRNDGKGGFRDVSRDSGVTEPIVGRGACRGDFDNDGKTDILLIPNIGPARLLRNISTDSNHWIGVMAGVGARVTVESGGIRQTVYVRSGASYMSDSDRRIVIGLGQRTTVERISVKWPNGHTTVRHNPSIDTYHLVEQDNSKASNALIVPGTGGGSRSRILQ